MMRAVVVTSAFLLPLPAMAHAETFADVGDLQLRYAEAHCSEPLAAQAASATGKGVSFASMVEAGEAGNSRLPWTEPWPPSEATVKTLAAITSGFLLTNDQVQVEDFLRRHHLQNVDPATKAAAQSLPASAALYDCLRPSQEELSEVLGTVIPPQMGEALSKQDCVAHLAPRLSDLVLSDLSPDEKRTQFQAIEAEQTACEGGA